MVTNSEKTLDFARLFQEEWFKIESDLPTELDVEEIVEKFLRPEYNRDKWVEIFCPPFNTEWTLALFAAAFRYSNEIDRRACIRIHDNKLIIQWKL